MTTSHTKDDTPGGGKGGTTKKTRRRTDAEGNEMPETTGETGGVKEERGAGRDERVSSPGGGDASRLWEEAGEVKESASRFIGDTRTVLSDVGTTLDLERQIEEHPIRTVAIAAGIGFVLGGGLFRPLVGKLIRTGVKLAVLPALRSEIISRLTPVVGELFGGGGEEERGKDGGRSRGGTRRKGE